MNFLFVMMLSTFYFVASTSMHTHKKSGQKEREEDGSYVHRDANHYDKNGKHNSHFDHEAILGSHNAVNEFDTLPPEIAKQKLKELAKKMDSNKDGHIDKKELKNWVLRSFRQLSQEEAEEKFEDEDENDDGKVSWAEHVNEVFGSYIDGEEISSPGDLEQEKLKIEDNLLFKAADKNEDGFLDVDEFIAFANPEEFEHMFDVLYTRSMTDKDKDLDGFLSLKEFTGEYSANHPEQYLVEKKRFEEDYDLNNDGKLDKKEILKWLVPDNDEIADDEVDHLFGEADENKDGLLSMEEVVDNHDVFVGSEVTDFGAHLHDVDKFKHEEL